MARTRNDLIQLVLARIDELSQPTGQNPVVSETTVGTELDEGANLILSTAKKQLVHPARSYYTEFCFLRYKPDGSTPFSIIMPLREDYLRFLRLKLLGWAKTCDEVVGVDSNLYRQQHNRFQVSQGLDPVVALVPFSYSETTGEGPDPVTVNYTQALEAFPVPDLSKAKKDGDKINANLSHSAAGMQKYLNTGLSNEQTRVVSEALIINRVVAENMPSNLQDPLTWLTANRVLTLLRETALAQAALAQFNASLGMVKTGMKGEDVEMTGQKK